MFSAEVRHSGIKRTAGPLLSLFPTTLLPPPSFVFFTVRVLLLSGAQCFQLNNCPEDCPKVHGSVELLAGGGCILSSPRAIPTNRSIEASHKERCWEMVRRSKRGV
jgi:hypothetical protein